MIVGVVGSLGSGKTYLIEKIESYLAKMGITTVRYSMADPVKYLAYQLYGFYKYQKEDDICLKNPSEEDIKKEFMNYMERSASPKMKKVVSRNWKNIKDFFVGKDFSWLRRSIIDKKNTKLSTRRVLQFIGTEIGRGLSKNIWADLAHAFIKMTVENNPHSCIMIDDMRFMNEYLKLSNSLGRKNIMIIKRNCDDKSLMKVFNCSKAELNKMKNHPSEKEWKAIPFNLEINRLPDKQLETEAFKIAEYLIKLIYKKND